MDHDLQYKSTFKNDIQYRFVNLGGILGWIGGNGNYIVDPDYYDAWLQHLITDNITPH